MDLIKIAALVAAVVIAFSLVAGVFHAISVAGFREGDR